MKTRFTLLLITATALFLMTGCTKQYVSTATIQFNLNDPADEESVLQALMLAQSTTADIIQIRNTELFQIRVEDSNPKKAADEANRLAETLQIQIKTKYPDAKVVIWERAEPMTTK